MNNIDCNRINIDKLPKFIIPEQKKSMIYPVDCKTQCQTDVFNKLYNIDPLKFFKLGRNRRDGIKISDEEFLKKYNILLENERQMSGDYYAVYNATTMEWMFYSYYITFIRYLTINKDIVVAPLFRVPNSNWIHNGNEMHNINDVISKLQYNISNNIRGWCDDLETTYAINNNLDHFDWAKEFLISVNLTLTGGNHIGEIDGEATLDYFRLGSVHTNGALNKINAHIDSLSLSIESKNIFKTKIKSFYDHYHINATDKSKKDISGLMQILIKKDIVDDVLRITTPYGFFLPVKPSVYLQLLQHNRISVIQDILRVIYSKNNSEFSIDGEETKSRMQEFFIDRGLLKAVQGRFIPVNEEVITKKGNIIINTWNDSGYDLNNKMYKLYEIIVSMLIECTDDANCLAQYRLDQPYNTDTYCNIQ